MRDFDLPSSAGSGELLGEMCVFLTSSLYIDQVIRISLILFRIMNEYDYLIFWILWCPKE